MNEQLGSKMRESLSALMDDEASELELHRVMRDAGAEESLSATWSRYHLASSAMRKELPLDFVDSSAELRAAISMALVNEPVPRRRGHWPQTLGRVAIAASVAVVAIFGAQQYQVFEPTASSPFVIQSAVQSVAHNAMQSKTLSTEKVGPQFQLPSGFEVPQATARTVSTSTYNAPPAVQTARLQPALVETPRASKRETDLQIQAYMQRLMLQQTDRAYRHSNPLKVPVGRFTPLSAEQ